MFVTSQTFIMSWALLPMLLFFSGTIHAAPYSIAVQGDGKILVGGEFTIIGGQARNNIARLNADGTADTTFDPDANNSVRAIAVQADAKILVGGWFETIGGQARRYMARLNSDGTVDTNFNPDANNSVRAIVVQADGKILVGGEFTIIGGQARNSIARLNSDGTADTTFNPDANNSVHAIAVQADGTILVGGYFSSIGGQARNNIARLHADGTADTTFNSGAGPNDGVASIAVQANGKILVGGYFSSIGGQARSYIVRLNAGGTVDTNFNPDAAYHVHSIAVQSDGKILVGGKFETIGGQARNYIARLNADGTADTNFNPDANNTVYSIAVQADGKILVGGAFTIIDGQARNMIARLSADTAALQNLSVSTDGTIILWNRSQSSPEVDQVIFEESSDMSDWTTLGAATRISGGWQLTGQSLPLLQNRYIKATGKAYGGLYSGSSSAIESVRLYYLDGLTFTITKTGTGAGTVTSNPAGINCGSDCSEQYGGGTSVDLTATASPGSIFTGWSGGGDCTGTDNPLSVVINSSATCTANFDLRYKFPWPMFLPATTKGKP